MSTALARGLVHVAVRLIPDKPTRARYREQWLADVEGAAELGLRPVPVAVGAMLAAPTVPLPGLPGSADRRRRILGILQLVFAFPYVWALLGYAIGVIQFGVSGQELFDLRPPPSSGCGTSSGCQPGEAWGSQGFIDAQGPLAWFPLIWLTGVDVVHSSGSASMETVVSIDGWAGNAVLAPFGLLAAIGRAALVTLATAGGGSRRRRRDALRPDGFRLRSDPVGGGAVGGMVVTCDRHPHGSRLAASPALTGVRRRPAAGVVAAGLRW